MAKDAARPRSYSRRLYRSPPHLVTKSDRARLQKYSHQLVRSLRSVPQ